MSRHFVSLLAVVVVLALGTSALNPGSSSGTCVGLAPGDASIQAITEVDFPSYLSPITEFSKFQSASFGRLLIQKNGDINSDNTWLFSKFSHTSGYTEYATQPSLNFLGGDLCTYMYASEDGRVVCSGQRTVIWLVYDSLLQTFSVEQNFANPAASYTRSYIHLDRTYVYDIISNSFEIFDFNGVSWATSVTMTPLPSATDAMAISFFRDEIAIVDSLASSIQIYTATDSTGSSHLLMTIPAPGPDVTDLAYDRDDSLIITYNTAGFPYNMDIMYRVSGAITPASPTVTILMPDQTVGYRICTTNEPAGEAFIVATAPGSEPLGPSSRGSVFRFRSPSPGAPYVLYDTYESQFSGTGVVCNNVGRTPADPMLAIAMDPIYNSVYGYYIDELNGQSTVYCNHDQDCDGSCSPLCSPSEDPCEIYEFDGSTCVFVGNVVPDTSDPCRTIVCDSNLGFLTSYNNGAPCTAEFFGTTCQGSCVNGYCDPVLPVCGLDATATPTPSTTATVSPTTTISATPTASLSQGASASNTASATQTPSSTPSPSVTASVSPTASTTASVSSSATLSQSSTPSITPTAGCGFCPMTDTYACRQLQSCDTFGCIYANNDVYCETQIVVPNDCYEARCTATTGDPSSGCTLVAKAEMAPCETGRPCMRNGRCTAAHMCVGIADDTVCDGSGNSQCAVNRCQSNMADLLVDMEGCKVTAPTGPCFPDDPCTVHSLENPTFCDPVSFSCVGGEEIVCLEGEHCELGVCVFDDDDDDGGGGGIVVDFDDDDDDDDDGLGGAPWWVWLIVGIVGLVIVCACCSLWAYLAMFRTNRDNKKKRKY